MGLFSKGLKMAKEYFSDLNYTLSNEDTRIEYDLLPEKASRVFSIAGSGARCMPLIARHPKELDVVDMSVSQNYLGELRYQAMKALTYEEYLFLLGYRGALQSGSDQGDDRWDLFKKIELSAEAQAYWEKNRAWWTPRGFILLGRWEAHFQKLGFLFREVLQCDFSKVFEAQNLEEQIEMYEKHWPHRRWKSFLRVVASEYVFNKFLYKGHFSGSEGSKTEVRPPHQFFIEEFERVFRTQMVRKNYFMQILFLGKITYEEGLPYEAHQLTFNKVKTSPTKVNYLTGNLLDHLPQKSYDFVSLSDTISYLQKEDANQILQKLHPETKSGSQVVIRSFLKAPTAMDEQGWDGLKEMDQWAHAKDGTGVYQFHIFKKK
jgi:S-adenosylmethionine-diacylglycerol 3-amino-3-carboxypropyl transferase